MPVITLGQDQDDVCYLTHHILTGKARLRLSKWNENFNDYSITKKIYIWKLKGIKYISYHIIIIIKVTS